SRRSLRRARRSPCPRRLPRSTRRPWRPRSSGSWPCGARSSRRPRRRAGPPPRRRPPRRRRRPPRPPPPRPPPPPSRLPPPAAPVPTAIPAEPPVAAAEPPKPPPAREPETQKGDLVGPGPGVVEPVLAAPPRVIYPEIARQQRVQGKVILLVLVDE